MWRRPSLCHASLALLLWHVYMSLVGMPQWSYSFDLYLCRWSGCLIEPSPSTYICVVGLGSVVGGVAGSSLLSLPLLLLPRMFCYVCGGAMSCHCLLYCVPGWRSGFFSRRGQEVSSSPEWATLVCHFRVGLYAALPLLPPWVLYVVLHSLRSPT